MVDVQDFLEAIKQDPVNVITTYSAVVSHVDDQGVVWVYIAGSDEETPTSTISTEVESGDDVNVEWRNNRLYIAGNVSNPSAGTLRVDVVEETATKAKTVADDAAYSAEVARLSAESAIGYAEIAGEAAVEAQTSADSAQASAISANSSANIALDQLGIVENVVGVLDLLTKHGEYQVTKDSEVIPDKWYFTRSGESPNYEYAVVNNPIQIEYELTSDVDIDADKTYYTRSGEGTEESPYVYTPVEEPDVSEIGTYYECIFYELVGIDEAIQNYVSSQLAVDADGLWLRTAGTETKVLLSATDGVVLYGTNGKPVGKYGSTAIIGAEDGFHIKMDATKLSFYDDTGTEVAYISNQQLYITQSVVLEQMDLGTPETEEGQGQWSWKLHENANGKNNMFLKWIG